ncbi:MULTISPECIES: serine/threonine-protein kinase [Streptomyces]|uniref:serine/threonine-protein kinase n=1 Tax=Streptomyces TaxID=1883 RepID=UPI00163C673B|nr:MULTISPECIES: serine/threonine-protein kinase [Streptomyces]MBC2877904.1 serine/threonine protein kinase [Streptomyces sp. TYQ1024]UBI38037.1 serine/threonine protein kinase [Streptomyces mobaraensis]UKW30624.1 serine/threonine protein kinase [Streptomyces sp. TYQ1024]
MDALSPEDPRTLGAYRLLRRLGAGGMGRVYLARSDRGRTVAVKLVQPELAGQEEFRDRFRREVRAARRVGGEWTAPVLDADTEAAVPWVATGYIAGPSLRQVIGRDYGPLPERSVRILAAGLARALQAVHAAGIVHRDLKPSNVLITLDGPRVIDFGIARALETVTDGDGLTRTGAAVGSPGFMSPEQVRGREVTPASDVFCMGSVLAYAATGRMPFGTSDSGVHALMFRVAEEEPDLAGVPEPLLPLITDCLAKDPAARPTTEQVLERTGAREELADLRSAEPWLPAGLVAQLGRHAVGLLDAEDPVEAEPPSGSIPASERPTDVVPRPTPGNTPPPARPPADPPTMTAVTTSTGSHTPHTPHTAPGPFGQPPPPPPGYGYPQHPGPYGPPPAGYQHPPASRSRKPLALVAIAAAGLLAGAGTVYVVKHQSGNQASPTPTTAPPAPNRGGTGKPGPTTGTTPTPSTSPSSTPEATGVARYKGVWQSEFGGDGRRNKRVLFVQPGVSGSRVEITGDGVLDDGTSYHCVWQASVTGGANATVPGPLLLGPSTVTEAQPKSACQPGSSSELVLQPDGRMRRDFIDSGTKDASLVYTKQ